MIEVSVQAQTPGGPGLAIDDVLRFPQVPSAGDEVQIARDDGEAEVWVVHRVEWYFDRSRNDDAMPVVYLRANWP